MEKILFNPDEGWIPVLNGECPEQIKSAQAGDWEWRLRDGKTYNPGIPAAVMYWSTLNPDLVAVRPIKPRTVTVTEDQILDAALRQSVKIIEPRTKTSVPPPVTADDRILARSKTIGMNLKASEDDQEIYQPFANKKHKHDKASGATPDDGMAVNPTLYPSDGYAFSGSSPTEIHKIETPQQRLTRQAWLDYEAAHPLPQIVPPIGEIEIGERIFAALCESLKGKN